MFSRFTLHSSTLTLSVFPQGAEMSELAVDALENVHPEAGKEQEGQEEEQAVGEEGRP
jgi:hypothetical protein